MTSQAWLVTGGAGYIGSHIVRALQAAGVPVVVVDDLSTGLASRVSGSIEIGSVADEDFVARVMSKHDIGGVIHLAARKQVEESVRRPLYYYDENVVGLVRLMTVMQRHGVSKMVFSSSAAVYGACEVELVSESEPTVPVNPYGQSKLIGEWLMDAQATAAGLRYVALRYFNVAGTAAPELVDQGATNLIPKVFQALRSGRQPAIYGSDYPTPDGTCIRDYVHVADLAAAHVAVLEMLGAPSCRQVFNVGRGSGYSVRQVLDCVAQVTGVPFQAHSEPRRPGDPARVVGSVTAIRQASAWQARFDLHDMVSSAWNLPRPLVNDR